jgi:hypothetical protein
MAAVLQQQIAGIPSVREGDALPTFIRQSRAEHDFVAQSRVPLGDQTELADPGWPL